MLKNAKQVVHILLRRLANRETEKLSDILNLFYLDKGECEKVINDIKQSKGEGVCSIIDGLDEFHPKDETKSGIHVIIWEVPTSSYHMGSSSNSKLLYGKFLPTASYYMGSSFL